MTEYDPQEGRSMPDGTAVSRAQSDADQQDVLAAVRGLAGLVSDVEDVAAVLEHIAAFAVSAVPGADGAGVTLVRADTLPAQVETWAATLAFVTEIDHLQYDICGEGPCLTAMQTGRVHVSGSLGSDARWPRFGGRAARLGVHSALSLPLAVGGTVVGAINVYARQRDAFSERALRMAETFAAPAAASVRNIQLLHAAHERVAQLQAALTTRAVIDQAIGIVRSRSGGSAQDAFARLRRRSQAENIKLAVVAARIVDEAVRRADARLAREQPG